MPQPSSDMKSEYSKIYEAESSAKNGGKYRLIAQRVIGGRKCRCYARVFMVGMVAYWNVGYIIDGKEPEQFNEQIRAMYELAQNKADELSASGQEVILWKY